ncbi:hypothetical protein HBI57_087240 [Parastagonospora nodorum]|nr:hypothetical protein HBI57_087240 [Parastagonospora nodorum]
MCAKNNLIRRKSLLLISTQTPNHVNIFSLDFAFLFANILLLIAFIISYCLFADKLRLTPSTLLARFIPITKIRNSLLKTTDTLHLLLKGLVIKMLDFMQDMLDDIYPSTIVSLLFVLKAPFALHFIHAVCNLVTLAQYKSYDEDTLAYIQGALERINIFKKEFRHALTHIIQDIRIYKALDSICTEVNSKAYYITIKEYILQICLHNSQRTALLAANYATILYLILTIINYICYDKDRKHIAYIRAFSKVLLFNNNRQINNTTRMLSMPFKFYNLSIIICLVHLVLRDLPNLITYTTMSYYVNNYIN